MARVYLAHDEILDRDVALKILREQYADDEEFIERFRQEARSAASLSHPNIISVYDQGRSEDGAYYMAMEYVPRGTLKDRIQQEGALAPDVAVGVALQIADALSAAHEKGVIHRDIKPQNVLITDTGDVKVTDFGIARAASAATMTRTGNVLGTAGYMSPEQTRGEPVGPRSDLYSLGVVLYEMLTGNLPYEADNAIALAMKHVSEPPPSPREANLEVSEALDALTMKLLAKNPEDRYASATALANDLEKVRSRLSLAPEGPEKTEEMATVLLPPRSAKERTTRTVVRPPGAEPVKAPGHSRKRRGRLFLLALFFGIALLAGLLWALQNFDILSLVGSPDQSNTESTAPTVQVPDLYWSTTAEADLANAGLRLGYRYTAPSDTVPANAVIYSDPAEGTEVEQGTAVDIYVSTGPEQLPAQTPSVTPTAPAQPQFRGDNNNGAKDKKKKNEGKGEGKGKD